MSIYNTDLAGLCEAIVAHSEDTQGQNYTFKLGKMNGMLDAIISPENVGSSPVEILSLQDGNGKLRTARVVSKTQFASDWAVDGDTAEDVNICDDGVEPEPFEDFVKIDDAIGFAQPLQFSHSKLKEYCENPQVFMQSYLNEALRTVRERWDRRILAAVEADIGVNYEHDGTQTAAGNYKSINLINADGTPNYLAFSEMELDYENNNLNGTPIIVGQGNWAQYYKLQNLVCCNEAVPFGDVSAEGAYFYKDQHANSVLGANNALVIAPGATQLITYQENASLDINNDLVKHITIPDPVYGNAIMWDLDFKWDECTKSYKWLAKTYFKVYNTFQAEAFPSGSPLGDRNGMTGIFGYTATKAS
jgi:hypothetical protein